MGKVVVKLAGRELLTWSGGKQDIRELSRKLERAAKSVRKPLNELVSLTLQSVVGASGVSQDAAIREMQAGAVLHYVLQLPTEQPAEYRTNGDHVAAGADLVFDLRPEGRGALRVEVTGLPET